jgi:hypothetical protein
LRIRELLYVLRSIWHDKSTGVNVFVARSIFWHPGLSSSIFSLQVSLVPGILDGVPGPIFCGQQGVQFFHIKAKIQELRAGKS